MGDGSTQADVEARVKQIKNLAAEVRAGSETQQCGCLLRTTVTHPVPHRSIC